MIARFLLLAAISSTLLLSDVVADESDGVRRTYIGGLILPVVVWNPNVADDLIPPVPIGIGATASTINADWRYSFEFSLFLRSTKDDSRYEGSILLEPIIGFVAAYRLLRFDSSHFSIDAELGIQAHLDGSLVGINNEDFTPAIPFGGAITYDSDPLLIISGIRLLYELNQSKHNGYLWLCTRFMFRI